MMTHVSSRYDTQGCQALLAECREHFANSELAEDFTQVSV
jgi:ribonuclease Z